jgi:hypothetical protein
MIELMSTFVEGAIGVVESIVGHLRHTTNIGSDQQETAQKDIH